MAASISNVTSEPPPLPEHPLENRVDMLRVVAHVEFFANFGFAPPALTLPGRRTGMAHSGTPGALMVFCGMAALM